MSSFVFACLLLASPFQDTAAKPAAPAPAAQAAPTIAPETKAALAAACKKLADAKSYMFDLTTEMSGGFGGGRGGDGGGGAGGGAPRPPQTTHVEFQSGVPMHVKQGDTEAYVQDGKIVHKNAEGAWELLDRSRGGRGPGGPGGPGGQGGAGGEGGGAKGADGAGGAPKAGAGGGAAPPKAGEGAGAGGAAGGGGGRGGRGPGGMMGGLMGLTSLRTPSALAKDFDGKIAEATMETKDGKSIIKGKLTEAAALALTQMGGRRRDGDDAGPERKATGLFEMVVAADGTVESIVLDTQMSMDLEDRHIDMKRKSTYAISKTGAVEVKVPEEVLTHFAS